MKDSNKIIQVIENQWPELNNEILTLFKDSIGVKTSINSNNEVVSKFGGLPQISKDFNYPYLEGNPLSFICQFKISEIRKISDTVKLPSKGMIYIFLRTHGLNRYPTLKNEFCVLYNPNENELTEYQFDKTSFKPLVFNEKKISFYPLVSIPEYIELISDDYSEYEDILEDIEQEIKKMTYPHFDEEYLSGSYFFGNPKPLQQPILRGSKENLELFLQLDLSNLLLDFHTVFGSSTAYFIGELEVIEDYNYDKLNLIIQNV